MADWIWNAAAEKGISYVEIDITHKLVTPKNLNLEPILAQLPVLEETISKTLHSQGFPEGFITEAKFHITLSGLENGSRRITCNTVLVDKDGRTYTGNPYHETSYENFRVFQSTLLNRIFRFFKG